MQQGAIAVAVEDGAEEQVFVISSKVIEPYRFTVQLSTTSGSMEVDTAVSVVSEEKCCGLSTLCH